MKINGSINRHSDNFIRYDNKTFFLETWNGEYFPKSSAYYIIKQYKGTARGVTLSKVNGKWLFTDTIK